MAAAGHSPPRRRGAERRFCSQLIRACLQIFLLLAHVMSEPTAWCDVRAYRLLSSALRMQLQLVSSQGDNIIIAWIACSCMPVVKMHLLITLGLQCSLQPKYQAKAEYKYESLLPSSKHRWSSACIMDLRSSTVPVVC